MEYVVPYRNQKYHIINLFGLRRRLPIIKVSDRVRIASNAEIILGDIEFISRAAEAIEKRISGLYPDVIITPEAKAISLAYEVAKRLGHKKFIITRKSVKSYMKRYVVAHLKSITTKEKQVLVLTGKDLDHMRRRTVCIVDDVVSTGGTINALENLVRRARPKELYKVSVWREGPWYKSNDLIYFDVLPIFIEDVSSEEMIK